MVTPYAIEDFSGHIKQRQSFRCNWNRTVCKSSRIYTLHKGLGLGLFIIYIYIFYKNICYIFGKNIGASERKLRRTQENCMSIGTGPKGFCPPTQKHAGLAKNLLGWEEWSGIFTQ